MSASKKKAHREFIENGIRMVQLEPGGEAYVEQQDFAKFVFQLPNEGISDPRKRGMHRLFQLAYPLLEPANQYRAAVDLMGDAIAPEFRTLRPRVVR